MEYLALCVHHGGAGPAGVAPIWGDILEMWWRRGNLRLAFSSALMYQAVMTDDSIDSLASKLVDAVPAGLKIVRRELEENFRSVLKTGLTRLNLVTREEFEVQEAVLARTREKLEAIDARLEAYEKNRDTS